MRERERGGGEGDTRIQLLRMRQAKLRERIDSRTCSHIGGIRRWVQRGLQRDRRHELTIKGSASINILIGD